MGGELVCRIRHTVENGENLATIIQGSCHVTPKQAGALAVNYTTLKGDAIFDLDSWAKYLQGHRASLAHLPVEEVKGRVLAQIAGAQGKTVAELPKDIQFVLVNAGDMVSGEVCKLPGGELNIVPTPAVQETPKSVPPAKPVRNGHWTSWDSCFSGDMCLKLADGKVITFREFSKFCEESEVAPEVASWDTDKNEIVYQRPTRVLVHEYDDAQPVMYLDLRNTANGEKPSRALEVTDVHRMLTDVAGDPWVAAGKLTDGTALIGGDKNTKYAFSTSGTKIAKTEKKVYNLSFTTPEGNLFPNYCVSADGLNWVIGHNIKCTM